ncbi:MAG: helix-turn-helix domain-containing protein [Bifidobacteriaceae bacterium]|jgi:transcriptional regulator with XRE-family HTH domain|nr:helix-turn-helix domain-containing protein [Bifidobacteriaceae bacterium]
MTDKNEKPQLGETIKKRRKQLEMTQEELAKKCFVSPQAVSKWENNTSMPDASVLQLLGAALKISVDDLLNGNIEPDESEKPKAVYGHIYGNVNKDIYGDVKTVFGNIDADIHGNILGNIVGRANNIFGNVEGNVLGEVKGDITGYIGKNLLGIVHGSVKKGVKGKVLGSIVKDGIGSDYDEKVNRKLKKLKKQS